jgi:hypothetical protein
MLINLPIPGIKKLIAILRLLLLKEVLMLGRGKMRERKEMGRMRSRSKNGHEVELMIMYWGNGLLRYTLKFHIY